MTQKVVVLRTSCMAEVVEALKTLGLDFVQEQHGSGPVHFACEKDGVVFEVYPAETAGGVRLLDF